MVKNLLQMIDRAFDWLTTTLPEADRLRGRALAEGLTLGGLVVLGDHMLGLADESALRLIVASGMGIGLLTLVPLLRWTGQLLLVTNLAALCLWAGMTLHYIFSVEPFFLAFLMSVPVAALFGNSRSGKAWTLVCAITVALGLVLAPHLSPVEGYMRPKFYEGAIVLFVLLGTSITLLNSERIHEKTRHRRQQADERLAEERRRFETLALRTYDVLLESSAEGRLLTVSPGLFSMLGYPAQAVIGRNALSFVHPEDRPNAEEAFLQTRSADLVIRADVRLRHQDGRWVWIRASGGSYLKRDGEQVLIFAARRIDEEKAARQRLLEMQTLRGLAQFAGGIAHDFNNLLTVISGYAELLEDSDISREIRTASSEASELTAQLLAFGRQQPMAPSVFDVNQLIRESEGMVRSLLRERINLHLALGANLTPIKAEQAQVRRALLNLATNARDAMYDGGHLRIATSNAVVSHEQATSLSIAPGQYVKIEVQDSGMGMSDAVRERAFEPFFTTKASGHGTGLGLPSVFGTIEQSGGTVVLQSAQDQGTTVTLYLPASQEDIKEQPRTQAPRLKHGAARTERVLVIEDQADVRRLINQALELVGFETSTASGSAEALSLVQHAKPFDLLVCDVVMPGLQGPELARLLRQQSPGLPTLFISGYHESDLGLSESEVGPVDFLPKPFSPGELVAAVEKLLEKTKRLTRT